MTLKKICTEFAIFDENDSNNDFASLLNENVDKYPRGPSYNDSQTGGTYRDKGINVRDLITAFTICNNVTPLFKDATLEKALGDLDYNKPSKVDHNDIITRNSPDRIFGRATY
jgi:hypothetical protein